MTKIPKTKKIKKCRLCNNKKLINIHNFNKRKYFTSILFGNHYVSNFVTKPNVKKGGKFILPFPNFKVLNN